MADLRLNIAQVEEPCARFEPNKWKRGRCKLCGKAKEEHVLHSGSGEDGATESCTEPEQNDSGWSSSDTGESEARNGVTRSSYTHASDRDHKRSPHMLDVVTPRKKKASEEEKYRQKKRDLKEELRAVKLERKDMTLKQMEMREALLRAEAKLADYEAIKLKNDRMQGEVKIIKQDLRTMTLGAAKACDANEKLKSELSAMKAEKEALEEKLEQQEKKIEKLKLRLARYQRAAQQGSVADKRRQIRSMSFTDNEIAEVEEELPVEEDFASQPVHDRVRNLLVHLHSECGAIKTNAGAAEIPEVQQYALHFLEGILETAAGHLMWIAEGARRGGEEREENGTPAQLSPPARKLPPRPRAPVAWDGSFSIEDDPPRQPRRRLTLAEEDSTPCFEFNVKRSRANVARRPISDSDGTAAYEDSQSESGDCGPARLDTDDAHGHSSSSDTTFSKGRPGSATEETPMVPAHPPPPVPSLAEEAAAEGGEVTRTESGSSGTGGSGLVRRTSSPADSPSDGKKLGRKKSFKRVRNWRLKEHSSSSADVTAPAGDPMESLRTPRKGKSLFGLKKKKITTKVMKDSLQSEIVVEKFTSFLEQIDVSLVNTLSFCVDLANCPSAGPTTTAQIIELYNVYIEDSSEKALDVPEIVHTRIRAGLKKAAEDKCYTPTVFNPASVLALQTLKPHFIAFVEGSVDGG